MSIPIIYIYTSSDDDNFKRELLYIYKKYIRTNFKKQPIYTTCIKEDQKSKVNV